MRRHFALAVELCFLLCFASIAWCGQRDVPEPDPEAEEKLVKESLLREIKETATWEVAAIDENPFSEIGKSTFKGMLVNSVPVELRGAQPGTKSNSHYPQDAEDMVLRGNSRPLPQHFSWLDEWPECIHSGRDQGSECGSCWAFGITNHLSDRFCIWGRDVVLSVQDLIECDKQSKCCDGGIDSDAYTFISEVGLVEERCKPYDLKCTKCRKTNCPRYRCKRGSAWYTSDTEKAKREIYYNGPIQAIFSVYEDFPNYKSGIYYYTKGDFLGIHTVEILGWGVEKGMRYWLCKNCWGDDWGAASFFKIKMGECGIDDYMSTCIPNV